ncbi:MAG TPA: methionine synthase [Candidatus Angelobacter sp.]|nr:methionine synthase [Candidatus Angelobacter sp.]
MSFAYRAEHVGSFLRPAPLLEARRNPAFDRQRLRGMEDEHIQRVLDRQKSLGFEVFTDGEFRRCNFMSDFTDAVEGFNMSDASPRDWTSAEAGTATATAPRKSTEREPDISRIPGIVIAKLRQVGRLTGHEVGFLKKHSPGRIKVTLPSATQFPAIVFKRGITDKVYKDHSALLWEIVEIMKAELKQLALEGVDYMQIDAPRYSYYIDPKWREWIRTEMKVEPNDLLEESIRADNTCLDAVRRPGVTLAMHICRGNNRSHWYAEGGYDAIAEKVFGGVNVDRFLLEYDDNRSGTFAPLRFVPRHRSVVLGLVSTKRPQLESGDLLMRRIDEASRYLPLECLALSPQCGFASTMEGNLLTEDEQWAKLRLVVETAHRVWG